MKFKGLFRYAKKKSQKIRPKRRQIRISLDIDTKTFRKFSIKCIKLGKRKSQVLRALLKDFLRA